MRKSILLAMSCLLVGLLLLTTGCSEAKKAPLRGVTIRSVVLQGDNGELFRNALLDQLVTAGVQRDRDKGVDLIGQVKWQGDNGDRPESLYVTVGTAENSPYIFSIAVDVRRGQPGLSPSLGSRVDDKSFARVAAVNVVNKMVDQYENQHSSPPQPPPQRANPRPPGG